MPPLDWGKIMGADLQSLQDNEQESEEIYRVITKVQFCSFSLFSYLMCHV